MKTVAIIQARMGSTRLPGKVLADIGGKPMLARVVERTARARSIDQVVVATSTLPADDPIAVWCEEWGWACHRGSEDDVLDRYYGAACVTNAEVVVRITSDCPLIDPAILDDCTAHYRAGQPGLDYVANFLPDRTFPRGLDCEVVSFAALKRAWRDDDRPEWREHVTEYILHHSEWFRLGGWMTDPDRSGERWTVDTPEDLELIRRIYAAFDDDAFGWRAVLTLLDANPDWRRLNAHVEQKVVA